MNLRATPPVLVTGATGKLGRHVVEGLLAAGRRVRVLTRRIRIAEALFGERVEIVEGRFENAASLSHAVNGVERVFLLSPIGETLAAHQIALVDVARAAGVQRIVKLSGSDWTIAPPGRSISGDAHAQVEAALAASGIAHAVIRPNAWMQVSLGRVAAALREGDAFPSALGEARVAYIDLRDIADVAVRLLLTDDELPAAPLVLTGAESLTHEDIAAIASRLRLRPVEVQPQEPASPPADADLLQRVHAQFTALIREGVAAGVTPDVPRILGRAPRTVEAWLREELEKVIA